MKILAVLPTYNEEARIGDVLSKFVLNTVNNIVVVDDGSTDKTGTIASSFGATLIRHESKMGVGEGIKDGIRYAINNGYDIAIILAGNGKDNPAEISELVKPIVDDNYDYVQGSRFLNGGEYRNTPLFRIVAIKLFSFIWSSVMGIKITDITNGFRAYRTNIFSNENINIWQEWLGTYELEYYLHYKVIKCGYKICEVSVSKNYPSKKNYTKIKPFLDWWRIIKPLVYLTLGIKK